MAGCSPLKSDNSVLGPSWRPWKPLRSDLGPSLQLSCFPTGFKMLQVDRHGPFTAPTTPKNPSRCSKYPPRGQYLGWYCSYTLFFVNLTVCMLTRVPKSPQEAPRSRQEPLRYHQETPKRPPSPRRPQDAPKMPPRCPQDALKKPQEAPRGPKRPQEPPTSLHEPLTSPQRAP